ncbi:MAG: hypothetical protein ACE5JL_00475 [Dehalococcoidia bacterium]
MARNWRRRMVVAGVVVVMVALISGLYTTVMASGAPSTPPSPAEAAPGTPSAQSEPDAARYKNMDQRLAEAGQRVPGFGGFFLDVGDNGIAHVYMVDPSQKDAAGEAVETILGPERFSRDIKEIRTLQGEYRIGQLVGWYHSLWRDVMVVPGVITTDLNEGKNRLVFGVENDEAKKAVEEELAKKGVPREAVIIEVVEPYRLLSHTVRSKIRPTEGGTQLIRSGSGASNCTLGFNTKRSGVSGVITASHCSSSQWAPDGSVFYQPTVSSGNRIGAETIDPPPFTGGTCPSGRACRYSDSTFVDLDSGVSPNLGFISKTTGLGSITIDHSAPRFRVVAEGFIAIQGERLDKVGRTTGWTAGQVISTCQNYHQAGTNWTMLCQDAVYGQALGGDSGAPVFDITNSPNTNDVEIKGVLWSGNSSSYVFSYVGLVYLDLGRSSTWDTCAPGFGC